MDDIIANAKEVYQANHDKKTAFGRCIFLSWYCDRGTCSFCFRAQTHHKIKHGGQSAKRSKASILTDAIIGNQMGWPIEFLTGGYGIFEFEDILDITKKVSEIYNKKIWVNLGVLKPEHMEQLKPYVEGICASIETVEPKLHNEICPDKPIEPYEEMLDLAEEMGFQKSITIVIGLEEKKDDIEILHEFIEKHRLDRITFYALKPVKGSPFTKSPDPEYYAWWIAKTRIRFPKLTIVAGLTPKNPDYTKIILDAGANLITKFPVLKKFNTKETRHIENMINDSGRKFQGTLTELPELDWDKIVDDLGYEQELSDSIKYKIQQYLRRMIENGKDQ